MPPTSSHGGFCPALPLKPLVDHPQSRLVPRLLDGWKRGAHCSVKLFPKLMLNSALIFGFSSRAGRRMGGVSDLDLSRPPAGTGCKKAALGAADGLQNRCRLPFVAFFFPPLLSNCTFTSRACSRITGCGIRAQLPGDTGLAETRHSRLLLGWHEAHPNPCQSHCRLF